MSLWTSRRGVLDCSPVVVPPHSPLARDITRPPDYRQPGFAAEFDAKTLFYDVIALGSWPAGRLVLVGPPLRNLEEAVRAGRLDGRPIGPRIVRYYERDRCSDIWLPPSRYALVQLVFPFGSVRIRPSRTCQERYAGRRVLYTLSKDNHPMWVVDWARYHVANHGADAVLVYDNGSTRYPAGQLLRTLRAALPGLVVDVLRWPYPYGPAGFSSTLGWDSDFCQAGAFQDARFRFLGRAAAVLNADVDELVVSQGGRSVFEAAEKSPAGCIAFPGHWVAAVSRSVGRSAPPRHADFVNREVDPSGHCPLKWCVVPARIPLDADWSTHHVRMPGFAESVTDEFGYRHFRAISTDWKYPRSAPVPLDPALHRLDHSLELALERAGLRPAAQALEDES